MTGADVSPHGAVGVRTLRRLASDHSLRMVVAALAAITVTNGFPGLHVERLWSHAVVLGWGDATARLDLSSVIVDGLMTAFFLCVGLEIRREIAFGTMRSRRAALMPVICAAGGMIVPAGVYVLFARTGESGAGWAIPTATDVVLAAGLLALVAPGVSVGARMFLLTLAVADDIGGVLIISVWYSQGAVPLFAVGAVGLAIVAAVAVGSGMVRLGPSLVALVPAWILMHDADIAPAIIGAVFGVLMPIGAVPRGRAVREDVERLLGRLEPAIGAVVLPLFAAVSASVPVDGDKLNIRVAAGVVLGLCLGKPLGIFGAAWVLVRLRAGQRPEGTSTSELLGVAILGGVGFTVSLYIANLSFSAEAPRQSATLGILAGSVLATIVGALYFRALRATRSRAPARARKA
jgi:NhaA family Na+:H+ antiporter